MAKIVNKEKEIINIENIEPSKIFDLIIDDPLRDNLHVENKVFDDTNYIRDFINDVEANYSNGDIVINNLMNDYLTIIIDKDNIIVIHNNDTTSIIDFNDNWPTIKFFLECCL